MDNISYMGFEITIMPFNGYAYKYEARSELTSPKGVVIKSFLTWGYTQDDIIQKIKNKINDYYRLWQRFEKHRDTLKKHYNKSSPVS